MSIFGGGSLFGTANPNTSFSDIHTSGTGGDTSGGLGDIGNTGFGQLSEDATLVGLISNASSYLNGMFNPKGPATSSSPSPPNASAVAGASLQDTLSQEQQQYNASTLLNGGGGLPMAGSPITASSVLRAGTR